MDEQQAVSQPQPTSFMTRAANIFMSPGEVYSEMAVVKDQSTSWIIPMILAVVVSMIFTYVIFSNPSFKQQILDSQRQAMEQKVAQGSMTREEATRAEEILESSNIMLYTGIAGSAIVPAAIVFCAALGLWLVAKFGLKSAAGYTKWLEVYGLASLVGIVGAIVSLITMHLFDSIHATLSGGLLLLSNFDTTKFAHRLIAGITLFGIWQTAVVGIGLAKLSAKPVGTGVAVAFVLWFVVIVASAASGFASF